MIDFLLGLTTGVLLGLTGGGLLGWYWRRLINRLSTPTEAPSGVTWGAEKKADPGILSAERDHGVVSPKTPQRIAWEAAQEIEREGLSLGIPKR